MGDAPAQVPRIIPTGRAVCEAHVAEIRQGPEGGRPALHSEWLMQVSLTTVGAEAAR